MRTATTAVTTASAMNMGCSPTGTPRLVVAGWLCPNGTVLFNFDTCSWRSGGKDHLLLRLRVVMICGLCTYVC